MSKKLFVGGLSYEVTDFELEDLFKQYGEVLSAKVIVDRYTSRSKGFAFVEMKNPSDAEKALAENGSDFMGRKLTVSEARP